MAEGMNSYSLADIAAMMRNNEGDKLFYSIISYTHTNKE